jgi:succinate dehydrogenase flavin-adding protein (antitoxin of CptAB toxin-antitoxin module)
MERRSDRGILDDDYILAAFARQLEEIRKLPEFAL